MPIYSYKDAHMVLAEPDSLQALNIIDLLSLRGFKNIVVCRNWEQLLDALAPRNAVPPMVDVLVCDVDLPGIDFYPFVQDIRHGRLGANPFLILIATAQPSAHADVSRVINSGVDDLLVKPMTAELLVRRLATFVENRNPFAITEAYVGPNRRGNRRADGSEEDQIEVPNTLQSKLLNKARGSELRAVLDAAREDMNVKKTEAGLKAIAGLIRRLKQQNHDTVRLGEMRRGFSVLAEKSERAVQDFAADQRTMATAEIAMRIARLARLIEASSGRPGAREFDLLEQLAEALLVSYAAPAAASEVADKIVDTVDDYLARDARG